MLSCIYNNIIFHSYNNEPESSTDPADENHQLSKCAYDEPGLRNTPSTTPGNDSVFLNKTSGRD